MAERHLHAITGELREDQPQTLADALDQLAGAENNVRSMRAQMAALKREIAGEVDREHDHFPRAIALFRYWQERTGHERMEFTSDRFALVLPFLKRHDDATLREAIRGAEFDPFIVTRKNGRQHAHNGWHQIFASEDKMQSFRERAPDYAPSFVQLSMIETANEVCDRVLERVKLIEDRSDPVAASHLLLEVNRLIRAWRENPIKQSEGKSDE